MTHTLGEHRPDIGVIGAGRFGLALSELIARNGFGVCLYTTIEQRANDLERDRALPDIVPEIDSLHESVEVVRSPEELAARCGWIILTVSTAYVTAALDPIGAHLDGAHMLVHAVHDLYGDELRRTSDIVRDHSPVLQIGVVAGPTHVAEMLAGQPNALVVGSPFPAVRKATQRILGCDNVRVYESDDRSGVELAAALGQVIAIGVGIADALDLGAATHATLITRGLLEITSIGDALGADRETFTGLAGLGRLIDAIQRGEPNYEVGRALALADDPVGVVRRAAPEAQGLNVVSKLPGFARRRRIRLPIATAIDGIARGEMSASDGLVGLLRWSQPRDVEL